MHHEHQVECLSAQLNEAEKTKECDIPNVTRQRLELRAKSRSKAKRKVTTRLTKTTNLSVL